MQTQSMTSARKALEDDIDNHAQVIINLKRQLNVLTTVARLPTELLSEIFFHIARGSYETTTLGSGYYRYRAATAWITVAHICHAWREVALDTPRLWSHIVVTRKRSVEVFLERSKKAPLWITAALGSSPAPERSLILEAILVSEVKRLTELRLSGPPDVLRGLSQSIREPAVQLETLVLMDNNSNYGLSPDHPHIPQSLSSHLLPRLRALDIRHLSVSWDHPIFCPTLTKLVLHGTSAPHFSARSFESLLSALEIMVALQELELEHTIPRVETDPRAVSPPARRVALPHLRCLTLLAGGLDCANLLIHLTLSAHARLHITCRGSVGGQGLINAVKDHLARSDRLQTIRLHGAYNMVLRGWRGLRDVTTLSKTTGNDLWLDIPFGSSSVSQLVDKTTVLAHVRTLEVELHYRDWNWRDVFAGMPNIRVLSVCGDQTKEFTEALSASRGASTLVLPYLEVPRLQDVHLSRLEYERGSEFLDWLIDCFIERCNHDLPVQELHLTQCTNALAGDVKNLREIVPDVRWDGVERLVWEEDDEEEEDEYEHYLEYGFPFEVDDDDLYAGDNYDLW